MTDTETSKDVKNAKALVKMLKGVAKDAEERAERLRNFVDLIDKATDDPKEILQIERGWLRDPTTVNDIMERVDAVCHIHSGSSEASRVRMLQRELFGLAAGKNVMGVR